jgi:hypothetical protein
MKVPAWLKNWLPLAIISTGAITFAYVGIQQNYRQSANDPQIQLAAEAAHDLELGTDPQQLFAQTPKVRLNTSTTVTIFDGSHHALASNSERRSDILPPTGSFDYAKAHGSNRFTWEPAPGTRQAAVLLYQSTPHGEYYVLADRSLLEVEERESSLTALAALALAAVLGLTLIATLLWRKN